MQNDKLTALDDSMLDEVSGGAGVVEAIGKLVTDMVADSIGIAQAMMEGRDRPFGGGGAGGGSAGASRGDFLGLGQKLRG